MIKVVVAQFGPNLIRHGLQVASGALVAHGYATTDQAQMLLGAALTMGAALWSMAEKNGLLKRVGL